MAAKPRLEFEPGGDGKILSQDAPVLPQSAAALQLTSKTQMRVA
jgi:hypothetical protein